MQRTHTYDVPSGDAVMAEGNIQGSRIQFEKKASVNKNDIEEWRPPYAPKLTDGEADKLVNWINLQEQRTFLLQNDAMYNFVKLVAGNLSQNVESLLSYQREQRHSRETFFDIVGEDSGIDIKNALKALEGQISDATIDLKLLRLYDFFRTQVERLLSQRDRRSDPASEMYLNKFADLESLYKGGVLGKRLYGNLLDYISDNNAGLTIDVSEDTEPEVIIVWLEQSVKSNSQVISADIIPSKETATKEQELERLEMLKQKTDIATVRMRMFAGLDWTERLENMQTADMSPELFMGLDKAVTLVKLNVRGLRFVPDAEAIINGKNRVLITLFAELTARQINIAHFFEGIRGSFDRNHARVRLSVERLLSAMRRFRYENEEIMDTTESHDSWKLDRLDFFAS